MLLNNDLTISDQDKQRLADVSPVMASSYDTMHVVMKATAELIDKNR